MMTIVQPTLPNGEQALNDSTLKEPTRLNAT